MVDFNGFDKGVIGRKLYSDKTLNNMKKADLIKLLHLAEENHNVLASFYANAVAYNKRIDANIDKALEELENEKLYWQDGHFDVLVSCGKANSYANAIEIVEKIRKE